MDNIVNSKRYIKISKIVIYNRWVRYTIGIILIVVMILYVKKLYRIVIKPSE